MDGSKDGGLTMGLLTSKKFQMAIVGVIVVIAKHFIPELSEVSTTEVLLPIVAYILGQGLADLGKEKAIIERG